MIAESLKKALLQAAIQGKLTEQLPEDGDARDLLKEIQKAKAGLIKEGKIKKEKALPEINEDEIPFDIPENWVWVRLGIVIQQNLGGGTPSKANPNYWGGDIYWASVKDLNDKYLTSTLDRITEKGLLNSSSNLIPEGNIIICTRMGLGKIAMNSIDVAINQDLRAIFLPEKIDKWYFFHFYSTLIFEGKGATVKGVTLDEINNTLMPLRPLAEQNRIVEKLESLLLEIESLKAEENKLDNLEKAFPSKIRASILQAAIQGKLTEQLPEDGDAKDLLKEIQKERARLIKGGKIKKEKPLPEIKEDEIPFDIPDNWVWVRLGDSNIITMGQSPDGSSVGKIDGIEFHQGKIFFTDKYIDDSELRCNKPTKIAQAGSILLCVRAPVGVVNVSSREICIGRGLTAINPFSAIDREYLYYYLLTLKGYFVEKSTGSTFKAISQNTISKAPIPIPPLAEQKRIVEKLEVLLPLCDALE